MIAPQSPALHPKHRQEWLDSGVHPDIIDLNVRSIKGKQEVSQHLNLSPADHAKYSHVFAGGWVCGDSLKPDHPRFSKGKLIKYESPAGVTPNPILLKPPETIIQAIAERYDVPQKPANVSFKAWFLANTKLPFALVEGFKKAGCVLSHALIPVVAIAGHTLAYKKDGDVSFAEYLHPEREIIICFDDDSDAKASKAVATTIRRIEYRLNPLVEGEKGKKKKNQLQPRARLRVAQWFTPEKGIDDVWAQHGQEEVERIIDTAIPISKWVNLSFSKLGFQPDFQFNSPKWQVTDLPEDRHLICVKGQKGTGKTYFLEHLSREAKANDKPLIAVTHRIQLSQSLAIRLGLTYIDDIEGKVECVKNIALCIDSLAKINPDQFKGALIVIDEVVQVLEHFLLGDTCKYKRQGILKALRRLAKVILESGGKFVIADADLNAATIKFFLGLLLGEKPYIIENTYREPSYKCLISNGFKPISANGRPGKECPADIVAASLSTALNGGRVLICCTGQKEESKWGSQTLELIFLHFGITSIVRIDSDTIKDPNHPAFRASNHINEICDSYQVVIATPSIGTGVSIENKIPFDLVYGIFTGVGSSDAVRQFLIRLRDKSVLRLIYCAEKGLDNSTKNLGATSAQVKHSTAELREFEMTILKQHDAEIFEDYTDLKYDQESSTYFSDLVAQRNDETANFKNYVRQGLLSENVEVQDIIDATFYCNDGIEPQAIYELAKEFSSGNVDKLYKKLAAQPRISDERYEELKGATSLTETERNELESTALSNRYGGIEVTEELAAKDADGWHRKIKLHYATDLGYEVTKEVQALTANKQARTGEGTLIEHDFVNRQRLSAQVEILRKSQLVELIKKRHEFSALDTQSNEVYEHFVERLPEINLSFGKNIKPEQFISGKFNFKLIQMIAETLGTKSEKTKHSKIGAKRFRHYSLEFPKDGRLEIFELWLERDKERAEAWRKRKREWEIKKLLKTIDINITVEEFNRIKSLEIFNDVWERVHTNTRIQIINRIDGFTVCDPTKIFVDATNTLALSNAFSTINSWDILACDSETYGNDKPNKKGVRKEGLHKAKAQVRLIQISNTNTVYTFDFGGRESKTREVALQNFKPYFNALLASKTKTIIGHNLSFDAGVWRHTFDSNFNCQFADTLLGMQIFMGIYNGSHAWTGGYGLGTLVQKFVGIPMDKSEQTSDWGQDLTASQIEYAALDPHRNFLLWQRMNELYDDPAKFGFAKLAQWDMRQAWKVECDCIAPLAEAEFQGMPINLQELKNLKQLVDDKLEETLAKWNALGTGITKPSQVQKLIDYLNQKYSLSLTKADKKSLADYKQYPEVALRFTHSGLIQYQSRLKKLIASASENNRAKTQYGVLTGTGRTSSGGQFKDIINIQSIPAKVDDYLKDCEIPSLRKAFKKEEGKALIVSDLAAAHARIACDFAKDELGMLVQNNDSIDAHSLFAIKIAQCIPEKIRAKGLPLKFLEKVVSVTHKDLLKDFKNSGTLITICKQLRDVSKNIFYGKLNGASWRRIQTEIGGQLKISITESEAKSISYVFEELYPDLTEYCKLTGAKLELEENQIWIDGKLFGISPIAETGQRLLFDLKVKDDEIQVPFTNCVAAQWSRTEATTMKKALVLCYKLFNKHPEWDAQVINIVHDELNVECDEQYQVQVAKVVAWVMSRNFQKELKNGVQHGCVDFKNQHPHKYKLDNNGEFVLNEKGQKIKDSRFETSIFSTSVDSWADK
jgi:DNA polymerase I-like protein with 3'-5' exonuclease and polymerase domains